jgi:uncharacterized protein (DUF2336 family)
MNEQESLIDRLESALASKDLSKRGEVLRGVTDLFIHGSGRLSDEQIDLFDEVMSKLIENVELAVRVAFGTRLARVADAPRKVIRKLAFDDAIEVAAPVLAYSERLEEPALVENARTMGQGHLFAISGRSVLTEAVTDILVVRGNHQVVARTASNQGAKFSTSGVSELVKKAENSGDLAVCIWSRPDIPRHELLKLFAHASEAVRRKLEAANPRQAALIQTAVTDAAEKIQATARAGSHEHAEALAHVRSLHSLDHLDETRLLSFVREGSFDKTGVALSLMCDLPIGLIERTLVQSESEQLLIFAKAIDLSWETTKAVLTLLAGSSSIPKDRLDRAFASFFRLQPKTARSALQFYRLREKASTNSN